MKGQDARACLCKTELKQPGAERTEQLPISPRQKAISLPQEPAHTAPRRITQDHTGIPHARLGQAADSWGRANLVSVSPIASDFPSPLCTTLSLLLKQKMISLLDKSRLPCSNAFINKVVIQKNKSCVSTS